MATAITTSTKTAAHIDPRSAQSRPSAECDPCAEHHEIAAEASLVHAAATAAEESGVEASRSTIDKAHDFLVGRFIPHLHTEQELRTRLAVRDHVCLEPHPEEAEVERLTAELAVARVALDDLRGAEPHELRRILFELTALVDLHFR